jgi:hypothetical protein
LCILLGTREQYQNAFEVEQADVGNINSSMHFDKRTYRSA